MFAPWGISGNMGGLLNADDQAYMRQQGLLGLGANLLAASGPSTTPRSTGQILGQGLAGMQQMQGQTMQSLLQNKLLKQKFDELEREKQREAKLAGLLGNQSQTYAPGSGAGMLENRQGAGLLGDLEAQDPNAYNKFYAGVAGLGGDYTKTGLSGLAALNAQHGRGEYSVPVYGSDGTIYAFDTRQKTLTIPPVNGASGKPVVGAQYNPRLQGGLAAAKTAGQETSKDYNELISGSSKVDDQMSIATDALRQFRDYSNSSVAGTGPFATGFGLKQYADADLQRLEAQFRTINLKNMAATFAGMSRAIDTQAERQAWEKTQPGITLDDPTNYQILVGNISMATKAKAESEARLQYIENSPDGSLKGYKSPVFGKTKTLFDAEGNATVVPNEQVNAAKRKGLMTADEFTKTLVSGKPQKQPDSAGPKNIVVDY